MHISSHQTTPQEEKKPLLRIVPVVPGKPTGTKHNWRADGHDSRFLKKQTKQLQEESLNEMNLDD